MLNKGSGHTYLLFWPGSEDPPLALADKPISVLLWTKQPVVWECHLLTLILTNESLNASTNHSLQNLWQVPEEMMMMTHKWLIGLLGFAGAKNLNFY